LILVFVGIQLPANTVAQPQPTDVSNRPSIVKTGDIRFANADGHELALDLYMPAGIDDPPLVVWVHGGIWRYGSRAVVNAIDLVEHGFAIASVSFRLSPVAPMPAQVHDIKAGIRFLRSNADLYGYNAERIAIAGASSGAHLAALVGMTNGSDIHEGKVGADFAVSSDVQAIVSYYGASNLLTILDQSTPHGLNIRVPALELLLGGEPADKSELARFASPVFHVDMDDPPLLLLHGDQDPQMPINQSHELHAAARQHKLDVHFEVVHGAGHGGEAFFDQSRTQLVAQFLNRQLQP
jgi:acetyl esterase/lipase